MSKSQGNSREVSRRLSAVEEQLRELKLSMAQAQPRWWNRLGRGAATLVTIVSLPLAAYSLMLSAIGAQGHSLTQTFPQYAEGGPPTGCIMFDHDAVGHFTADVFTVLTNTGRQAITVLGVASSQDPMAPLGFDWIALDGDLNSAVRADLPIFLQPGQAVALVTAYSTVGTVNHVDTIIDPSLRVLTSDGQQIDVPGRFVEESPPPIITEAFRKLPRLGCEDAK